MPISKVLELARAEVGYQEGTNNDTKFGKWYGLNHQPWCDMAVSKIFFDAGDIRSIAPASKPKGFASCDEHLKYLSKNGQLVPLGQAKAGDLVFFQFDDDAQPDHIGIIKSNNPQGKFFYSWEGNTASGVRGSQSNGDGFYLRKRDYSLVMAIARPKTT